MDERIARRKPLSIFARAVLVLSRKDEPIGSCDMGCLPSKPKRKHHLRDNFVVERNKSVEDDYKIIKQIGKGSIGVIYLAECRPPKYVDDCSLCAGRSLHGGSDSQHSRQLPLRKGFQRQYAIKEIDASMIDERAFDSLITEIRLLKTLDHPFIIKVFGSYTEIIGDREKLSVVMELCKGGALDKYVPYKEETASVLVANVIEAVLYLHNHNVIHRDLKVRTPSSCVNESQNILCTHEFLSCRSFRMKMSCSPMKQETQTIYDCLTLGWPRFFRDHSQFEIVLGLFTV